MKNQLLITLLTLTVSAQAQITIPNASFENWTTGTVFNPDIPVGWKTYSVASGAVKTTDSYSGVYALKLKLNPNSSPPDVFYGFSFPATVAPMYFSYWAKVHLSGYDKLIVSADTYNKTTSAYTSNITSNNYTSFSQNTNVWTLFTYTLGGNSTASSDSARIRFSFTSGSDTANQIIIDDLVFSNAPAGVNELSNNAIIESTFPNPANTDATLLYRINEPAKVSLTLYDILGKGYPIIEKEYHQQGSYKVGVDDISFQL